MTCLFFVNVLIILLLYLVNIISVVNVVAIEDGTIRS